MRPCLRRTLPCGSQHYFCILGYFTLSLSLFYSLSLFCFLSLSHPCRKMLFKALKGWTVIFKKLNEYACWLRFLPEWDDALLMWSGAFSVASLVCVWLHFPLRDCLPLREHKSPTPVERIYAWISNAFCAILIVHFSEKPLYKKFCEVCLKK